MAKFCTAVFVLVLLTGIANLAAAQETGAPLHPGYPSEFDKKGHVDGLKSEWIVIDDFSIKLTPGVIFNAPEELNCGRSKFNVGDLVGVVLDSREDAESIWLIQKNSKKN